MVMPHNHRVGDIPTIQAAPPVEIHLAACVQNVHEIIMDHMALTTLAFHMRFSFPSPIGRKRHLTAPLTLSVSGSTSSCRSKSSILRPCVSDRFRLLLTLGDFCIGCIDRPVFPYDRLRPREKRGNIEDCRNERRRNLSSLARRAGLLNSSCFGRPEMSLIEYVPLFMHPFIFETLMGFYFHSHQVEIAKPRPISQSEFPYLLLPIFIINTEVDDSPWTSHSVQGDQ